MIAADKFALTVFNFNEFVTVEKKDKTVRIARSGDNVHVFVDGKDGEKVKVEVPVKLVAAPEYQPPGPRSKVGLPSGNWWNGCKSIVKIAICGDSNRLGSSSVPAFSISAPGIALPLASR